MSNQGQSVARQRPATVTAAAIIQIVLGVVSIINTLISMAYSSDMVDAMREYLESQGLPPGEVDQLVGGGSQAFGSVIGIVLAVAFIILGFTNLRGNRVSRIITWILSGLLLLCLLVGTGLATLVPDEVNGVDLNGMIEAGNSVLPSWYEAVSVIGMVVSIIGYIAVVILLALPASNAYFAKREPEVFLPPEGN